MPEQTQRGSLGNLAAALLLLIVALAAIWLSLGLDRPSGWLTAPGMVPLILAIGLAAMAVVLLWDALCHGALAHRAFVEAATFEAIPTRRLLSAIAGIGIFYFILLRFLPFEIGCFMYLAGMYQVFWPGARWWKKGLTAAGISVAFVVAFQAMFDIPLPGQRNLIEALLFHLRR